MKEYHLTPDGLFIVRQNNKIVALLENHEIGQFSILKLPQGCTEVLVGVDGIIYATINKAMEGIKDNPLMELISKEKEIFEFYNKKLYLKQDTLIE